MEIRTRSAPRCLTFATALIACAAAWPATAPAAAQGRGGPPVITLSSARLEFTAEQGENPRDQRVTLGNVGRGRLNWQASADASWLELSPRSGRLRSGRSRDLRIRVRSRDLNGGEYEGRITISGNAANSPRTIEVRLTVTGGAPAIALSPGSLEFSAGEGESAGDRELTITNTGTGTLDWSAADDAEWLNVDPGSGRLEAGSSRELRVRATTASLASGSYSATVTVSGNAANSPQTVRADLDVQARPLFEIAPESLRFDLDEGDPPAARTITVRNAGQGTLDWSAAGGAAWLTVTPGSGSLSSGDAAEVTIAVSVVELDLGSHSATLIFEGNARNAPRSIDIGLSVRTHLTLDQLVAALAGAETLSEGQVRFLDSMGNDNGRFDLGDFLAWLEAEAPPSGDDPDGDDSGDDGAGEDDSDDDDDDDDDDD